MKRQSQFNERPVSSRQICLIACSHFYTRANLQINLGLNLSGSTARPPACPPLLAAMPRQKDTLNGKTNIFVEPVCCNEKKMHWLIRRLWLVLRAEWIFVTHRRTGCFIFLFFRASCVLMWLHFDISLPNIGHSVNFNSSTSNRLSLVKLVNSNLITL